MNAPFLKAMSLALGLITGTTGVLTSAALTPARAAATQEQQAAALVFFEDISGKAFAVLRDKSLTEADQRAEFRRLFAEVTDVQRIGAALLGFHRRKFDEMQMERYTSLLPSYVVALYTDRLTEVGDEEVTIERTYTQGKKDIWVVTSVTSPFGGDDLRADWRMRPMENGDFMVMDVKVENISLFQTKKDEFMSFLSNRGIEEFLTRLEKDAEADEA
ncbi:MAG: ABC transporter substrate-binding protein [Pseudomonadota bacterium]